MSAANKDALQRQCNAFNAHVPVGSTVEVRKDRGEVVQTVTRSPAQVLSGHTAVIWLEGISGCYLLERVTLALKPCPLCGNQPVRNGRSGIGGVLCAGDNMVVGLVHRLQTYGACQAEADAAWNILSKPASATGERGVFPAQIGRLSLGEQLSDGEDRQCAGGCDQPIPAGHAIYWPERIGEYPDHIDPACISCAIAKAENEQGWCDCEALTALAAAPTIPATEVTA